MADQLFEDADFPTEIGSIYYDGRADDAIQWRRPGEICENPVFINQSASKYDIDQGKLGDCWFLSAAAVLATRRDLFGRVVPQEQGFGEGYTGQFTFTFWRYGEWTEVTVDDRLPTKDNKLLFCNNQETPNEFWSPLLEKAYAKLHLSYQALHEGFSQDALVDFTGGIGEFIDLGGSIGVKPSEDGDEDTARNIKKLYKRLKRLHKKQCSLLCCAIQNKTLADNGLVKGHGYSITSIQEVTVGEISHKLLRLLNPWGRKEWNGAWSDGSAEWDEVPDDVKTTLNLVSQNEGEFWISVEDWVENFDMLSMCHLTPEAVQATTADASGERWHTATYHGEWVRGATAGGNASSGDSYWLNPQFFVRLLDPDPTDEVNQCTLIVSLMQKHTRLRKTQEGRGETEAAIAFDIHKYRGNAPEELDGLRADHTALRLAAPMPDFDYLRERSRRYTLDPGVYCIIPCTYEPDVEGAFLLRIATERPMESGEVDSSGAPVESRMLSDADAEFQGIFERFAGDDSVVDARELRKILNGGLKREQDEEFSKETSRALIHSIIGDKRGTLDVDDCRLAWRRVKAFQQSFDQFDKDHSGSLDVRELRQALKAAGYRLSRNVLAELAKKYCGKSDALSLDDYVLCATKITTTNAAYEKVKRRSGGTKKVELSYEEVLQMAL